MQIPLEIYSNTFYLKKPNSNFYLKGFNEKDLFEMFAKDLFHKKSKMSYYRFYDI